MWRNNGHNAIYCWVTNTGLIKDCKTPGDVGLHDIESFYVAFKDKISRQYLIQDKNLFEFLKEYYPAFDYDMDETWICSHEYPYIYILFLHFSTILCQEYFFQEASMKCSNRYQHALCMILTQMVDRDRYDKESLKEIMQEASKPRVTQAVIKNFSFSNPGTPNSSTPTTTILNRKTAKVNALEAQLQIEREKLQEIEVQYQRKVAELKEEIKSLTEKNLSLQRENFEKMIKIASFSCDIEIDSARKALLKKIAAKDESIIDLKMEISTLKSDNESLFDKTRETEIELEKCIIKNNDLQIEILEISQLNTKLEMQVEELNSDIMNSKQMFDSNSYLHSLFKETGQTSQAAGRMISQNSNANTPDTPDNQTPGRFAVGIPKKSLKRRLFHRSTTHKDSKRYQSLEEDFTDDTRNETQLSILFESFNEHNIYSLRHELTAYESCQPSSIMQADSKHEEADFLNTINELKAENDTLRKKHAELESIVSKKKRKRCNFCVIL